MLGKTPYEKLINRKEDISKAYEAKATIVSATKMNPQILMEPLLFKRKIIIAQIDSTPLGLSFLKDQIKTCPVNELDILIKRLNTGTDISNRRKQYNKQLILIQKQYKQLELSETEIIQSLKRHLGVSIKELKEFLTNFKDTPENEIPNRVILSELRELRYNL